MAQTNQTQTADAATTIAVIPMPAKVALRAGEFRLLAGVIPTLNDGGVVINCGSAVILPEVFLKSLTVARNLGHPVRNFTAINMDMIQHYRPNANVVSRPTRSGGTAVSLTGHHEIMLPLLYAGVKSFLREYR